MRHDRRDRLESGNSPIERRQFLATGGRAAIGLALLPVAACSRSNRAAPMADRSGTLNPLIEDLEKQVPGWMSEHSTPALSMALVDDAEIGWRRAFGVKDFPSRRPADDDTVFEAGSVSKTVFAYAVLQLCDKGVLDLDAPLTKYTPERLLDDPRLDLITTRRVLCHTTGLPNWRSHSEPMKISFTPGEKWSYSGEGYSYLQSVVTHLTGHVDLEHCSTFEQNLKVCATDIDSYMKANVLVPFGMTSSGYVWTDAYDRLMALPHDDKGRTFSRRTTPADAARYASSGALHTTASEYAKFLIEVIDPKPADAFRLSAGIRAEMLRPQVQVTGGLSWGLGWAVERHGESDVITHSGDNPGYKAFTAASVGKKSGYVILTNSDTGFEVIRKIVQSDRMQQFLPVTL